MARKRFAEYKVNIRTQVRGDGDLPGFLDMLRYEGGQVISWDRTDSGFTVSIRVEGPRFVPDRWKSFGIWPQDINEDVYA